MRKVTIALGVIALVVVIAYLIPRFTSGGNVVEVRWLIAHQPVDLFEGAAEALQDTFNAASPDTKIRVTIIGPADVAGEGVFHLTKDEVYAYIAGGGAQLATIPVASFGSDSTTTVLALPFLFRNYETFAVVSDGSVGDALAASISGADMKALAFTLSGGFQTIVTRSKEIHSAGDLTGLRVATPNGRVAQDSLRAFGAEPVAFGPGDTSSLMRALDDGEVDGVEIPYTRLSIYPLQSPIIVNETSHSMFLTVVLGNTTFLESLSAEDRAVFEEAVQAAAAVERHDSIQLAQVTRSRLHDSGSMIVTLADTERQKLISASANLYEVYANIFGHDLIDELTSVSR